MLPSEPKRANVTSTFLTEHICCLRRLLLVGGAVVLLLLLPLVSLHCIKHNLYFTVPQEARQVTHETVLQTNTPGLCKESTLLKQ